MIEGGICGRCGETIKQFGSPFKDKKLLIKLWNVDILLKKMCLMVISAPSLFRVPHPFSLHFLYKDLCTLFSIYNSSVSSFTVNMVS